MREATARGLGSRPSADRLGRNRRLVEGGLQRLRVRLARVRGARHDIDAGALCRERLARQDWLDVLGDLPGATAGWQLEGGHGGGLPVRNRDLDLRVAV